MHNVVGCQHSLEELDIFVCDLETGRHGISSMFICFDHLPVYTLENAGFRWNSGCFTCVRGVNTLLKTDLDE